MSLDGYFYEYDNKGNVYYSLVSKVSPQYGYFLADAFQWAERGSAAEYIYNDHLSWNERLNLVCVVT